MSYSFKTNLDHLPSHGGVRRSSRHSEANAGFVQAQAQPGLHCEFKASLNDIARFCLKKKQKKPLQYLKILDITTQLAQ